jgi:hypothetical protein
MCKTFCFRDGEMGGGCHCVYSLHNILLPVKKIGRSSFKAQVGITVQICAVQWGMVFTSGTFNFAAGSVRAQVERFQFHKNFAEKKSFKILVSILSLQKGPRSLVA